MIFTYTAAKVFTLRNYKFEIVTVNNKFKDFFFFLRDFPGIMSYSEHVNFDGFICIINYWQCNLPNKFGLDFGFSS